MIHDLLADLPGPERHRIRDAGVPRTTYQTIRHRALASSWLRDRYVPNPSLLGFRRLQFLLAQPYAERRSAAVQTLRTSEDVVVLWTSPETVFAVVFERGPPSPDRNFILPEQFRRSWTVQAGSSSGGILAYFDYEGAWSTWALGVEPIAYPKPFPGRESGPPTHARTARTVDLRSLRMLVTRPFNPDLRGPNSGAFSPGRLSRRERNLIIDGSVAHIVLPDFSEIPPIQGHRPDRVVFVTGRLRGGASARELFSDLRRGARVAPFFYVYDGERVLFAGLSPAPPGISQGRSSVLGVIERFLERIEVVREPLDTLFPLVDHRYDRLVSSERLSDHGKTLDLR